MNPLGVLIYRCKQLLAAGSSAPRRGNWREIVWWRSRFQPSPGK